MIKVKGLTKSYGSHRVLDGIDIDVKKGKIYGFLGHNGVGKSTTMNILTGLIDYNGGEISIDGMDLKKKRKEIMNLIGYLPEEPMFYPYMSGREYLNFIGEVSGYNKETICKRTDELLEQVKLKGAAKRKIGGYSRGMRQRLGLATAVYNKPKILFLDEPSSALDPEGRKDIVEIIESLKSSDITVFLSTHILSDVERVCDQVAILNKGKIMLEGSLDEVINNNVLPVYDVEFEENCEDIEGLISKESWVESIEVKNNLMNIYLKDSRIGKTELLKALAQYERPILSYNIRKSNLEDIFMKVVKTNE